MTDYIRPPKSATYRIKIPANNVSSHPLYMELDQGTKKILVRKSTTDPKQKAITPLGSDRYKIQSDLTKETLTFLPGGSYGKGYLVTSATASTEWFIELNGNSARIRKPDDTSVAVDSCNNEDAHFWGRSDGANQKWLFEISQSDAPSADNSGSSESSKPATRDFQSRFFKFTPERAALEKWDIIIIGSGIGGGIVAHDLFDTNSKLGYAAKKVLVIEKGNLVFHSHCLNAARPSGLGEDRGQQNDTFFAAFKDDYTGAEQSAGGKEHWKGGPMYCLGGRSTAWGLFAPRVHDKTLENFFPQVVADELLQDYYEKAEKLMNLSLPSTQPMHQHLMDRLNMVADDTVNAQWMWGRIASEFADKRNFDFAEGAYSTTDKLLEIAMSKPLDSNGDEVEHKNFSILLGTEVRELRWGTGSKSKTVIGIRVKTAKGNYVEINLTPDTGKVVVGAGSVHSPAILMRSGVDLHDTEMGGCRITDHDILFKALSFRYRKASDREDVGAMKLQTYANISNNDVALVNMSIDASSFLPRANSPLDDLPKFIMVFIMRAPLRKGNDVKLVGSGDNSEPVVTIKRSQHDGNKVRNAKLTVMETMTKATINAIRDVLKVDFIDEPTPAGQQYFKLLQLGGVAHELGTVPMPLADGTDEPYCINSDLKLRGYEGVYVCDLSIFPYSPEANPTLTLAALAIRLSRHLLPRLNIHINEADIDKLWVVNHTGRRVQVWVSNRAEDPSTNKPVPLDPGRSSSWNRKKGTPEAVTVYKLNPNYGKPREPEFNLTPELFVGQPGVVLPIV